MKSNPLLRAALACAGKGWPVFPCHPDRKAAATPNGYLDATTGRDQIREWFAGHPEWNLAVATGAPGPDVLDLVVFDREGDFNPALWRLREAELLGGATAFINTPNGGLHIYFDGSSQPSGSLRDWDLDFIRKAATSSSRPPRSAAPLQRCQHPQRRVRRPGL
jgi:hypothetical protein